MSTDHTEAATTFLQLVTANRIREAYERFVAPTFRHHNPWFRGDAASLMAGMEENAAKSPGKVCEVKQAIQQGDRVAVHSHVRMKPGETGIAVVHIFRFEGDRIAELWDVAMAIPEDSKNENGMF
jgi:predicted SnoaL-like aldol condensation-catalyzing enzyme